MAIAGAGKSVVGAGVYLAVILLLAPLAPAVADKGKGLRDAPPIWNELGPAERRFLKPHSGTWHTYPPNMRRNLRKKAQRLMEMDPEQLDRLRRRAREFRRLPPPKQQELCRRFRGERGYLPPPCIPRN